MAEWFKAHAWKVCVRVKAYRGFESLFLRQIFTCSAKHAFYGLCRYLRGARLRTPPGPEGSNGSDQRKREVLPAGTTYVKPSNAAKES
jgi:hypothetical protein